MIFGLPLLGGAALLGTAAFGIAKLAGASTRKALLAGLGVFGGSAALGAMTGAGAAAQTKTLADATGAGSLTAAQESAALQASMGGGQSAILGKSGTQTAFGGVGGIASPVMGPTLTGAPISASVAPDFMLSQVTQKGLAGQGLSGAAALERVALDIPTTEAYTGFDAAGNVVTDLRSPEVQAIARPGMDQAVGTVATTPSNIGANLAKIPGTIGSFVKENPVTTGIGVLTGAKMLGDLTQKQKIYDDSSAEPFSNVDRQALLQEQKARFDPTSEREEYVMAPGALTPENVYERQEEMFAARQGGLATLKLKEGGVNYLPSKSDHDEKDANNYVRAMGYVEDGSGNGDKDEDTMLAQLADGEFVSRADAILGAGIMTGANPDDFKEMRRKGAQFFYKQQDSFKRVYDLVNDRNKAS